MIEWPRVDMYTVRPVIECGEKKRRRAMEVRCKGCSHTDECKGFQYGEKLSPSETAEVMRIYNEELTNRK